MWFYSAFLVNYRQDSAQYFMAQYRVEKDCMSNDSFVSITDAAYDCCDCDKSSQHLICLYLIQEFHQQIE